MKSKWEFLSHVFISGNEIHYLLRGGTTRLPEGGGEGRNRMKRNQKEWPCYIPFTSITHKLQELPFGPFGLRADWLPGRRRRSHQASVSKALLYEGQHTPAPATAEGLMAPRVPPPFSVAAVPRSLFNVAGDI